MEFGDVVRIVGDSARQASELTVSSGVCDTREESPPMCPASDSNSNDSTSTSSSFSGSAISSASTPSSSMAGKDSVGVPGSIMVVVPLELLVGNVWFAVD